MNAPVQIVEIVHLEPKVFSRAQAARYCRRTEKKFRAQYRGPVVIYEDGTVGYDRADLDQWIQSLKTGASEGARASDEDDLKAVRERAAARAGARRGRRVPRPGRGGAG